MEVGCNVDFLINILLTLLGWFPGNERCFVVYYLRCHPRILHHSQVLINDVFSTPAATLTLYFILQIIRQRGKRCEGVAGVQVQLGLYVT